ncbi:uncharacterized protein LOC122800031 [Protopterus annectens]|uniref:uncharacterized protein LOC122800031 n=1 Tax=Protopterus annectens TaxID=7888 RepID=UPI001CFA85DE|nr:uncharacterized protein LOC122800031 [Protopterus annectens]
MLLKVALCLLWGITILSVCGTSDGNNWGVWYSPPINAVKGKDVKLNSTFDFPAGEQYKCSYWFKSPNETQCPGSDPAPSIILKDSVKYQIVEKARVSNLTIRDVDISDTGRYCFRFKTNGKSQGFTGRQGILLQIDVQDNPSDSTAIGAGVGVTILILVLIITAFFVFYRKNRAKENNIPVCKENTVPDAVFPEAPKQATIMELQKTDISCSDSSEETGVVYTKVTTFPLQQEHDSKPKRKETQYAELSF